MMRRPSPQCPGLVWMCIFCDRPLVACGLSGAFGAAEPLFNVFNLSDQFILFFQPRLTSSTRL